LLLASIETKTENDELFAKLGINKKLKPFICLLIKIRFPSKKTFQTIFGSREQILALKLAQDSTGQPLAARWNSQTGQQGSQITPATTSIVSSGINLLETEESGMTSIATSSSDSSANLLIQYNKNT